jgi:hypothetical protein
MRDYNGAAVSNQFKNYIKKGYTNFEIEKEPNICMGGVNYNEKCKRKLKSYEQNFFDER